MNSRFFVMSALVFQAYWKESDVHYLDRGMWVHKNLFYILSLFLTHLRSAFRCANVAASHAGGAASPGGEDDPRWPDPNDEWFLLDFPTSPPLLQIVYHSWVDKKLDMGQTRCIDEDIVKERVLELTQNPPAVALRLVVYLETGIFLTPFVFSVAPATEIDGIMNIC